MLKIANFITLDSKFADGVMWMHDLTAEHCTHEYLAIAGGPADPDGKYLKNRQRVRVIGPGEVYGYLVEHGFQAVLIHSLHALYPPDLPKRIMVFWFAWGYDIYMMPHPDCPAIVLDLYGSQTRSMLEQIDARHPTPQPPPQVLGYLKQRYAGAVSRVDYFSGVIPSEYELMRPNRYFRARRFDYGYGNRMRFEMMENNEPYAVGDNILIGNSADPCGNHLDVLPMLRGMDLAHRQVIVPLSYPENFHIYAHQVAMNYTRQLGSRVRPLTGWLPLAEYSRLLDSCGTAIFAHERQQAVGNLILTLWKGAKVFMADSSEVFRWYRSLGMHVFGIRHELTEHNLNEPLTVKQRDENRAILYRLYSQQAAIDRLMKFYSLVVGHTDKRKRLRSGKRKGR